MSGLVASLSACSQPYTWDGSLEALLASQPEHFATVLEDPARYRVQIIYTQIDRDADNVPTFISYSYRSDPNEYFYPASTVKLPTALLALEKLRLLGIEGLDRNTTMLVGEEDSGESVGHSIREILLVSSNQAFNRLYDFLGQDQLNLRMRQAGFEGTRIMHRLERTLSVEENRQTGPVRFVDGETVLHQEPPVFSETDYTAKQTIPLGRAEIVNGERIEGPKDFAVKNAYPLQDQHDFIKALMFPNAVGAERRFQLDEEDYTFLYRNMSAYPGDSGIPEYANAEQYPDGYVKFLMYGGDATSIPGNIRIFNKVGDAYGFLTDAAYIVDVENGIEFILAATIHTNANETFNDEDYEYDDVGLPFLRHLGQAIYELELQRERPYQPEIGRLVFD